MHAASLQSAATCLDGDGNSRRQVRYANRTVCGVHVLASRARRAESVYSNLLVLHDNLYLRKAVVKTMNQHRLSRPTYAVYGPMLKALSTS